QAMHYFSRAPSLPPATPSEPRPLAPEESESMIVNSFGQIAPQTVHDHEVPEGRHQEAQAATGPVRWRRDNSGDRAQWRVQLGQVGYRPVPAGDPAGSVADLRDR